MRGKYKYLPETYTHRSLSTITEHITNELCVCVCLEPFALDLFASRARALS